MIKSSIPRIVISALHSGAGKTTTAIGIAGALQRLGLTVSMFKCGPDYLDPSYHHQVTGRPAYNLDGWLMGSDAVKRTFIEKSAHSDIAIIEGVMGFLDGASPQSLEGSTAEIARWLHAPIIPVIDVSGMSGTIKIAEAGFLSYKGFHWGGMVANQAGSRRHLQLIAEGLNDLPLIGGFVKSPQQSFPERYLGLKTARSTAEVRNQIKFWVDDVAGNFDLQKIISIAASAPDLEVTTNVKKKGTPRCRIAYAYDDAFHFYYPDNLHLLELAGAEMIPFSPIQDAKLPPCDGLYIGGGYPELFAKELASNRSMAQAITDHAQKSKPIYAECGGLIYLSRAVKVGQQEYKMLGLIPGEITIVDKLQALGYAEIETTESTILGPSGTRFKGHQFRYSHIDIDESHPQNYKVIRRRNQTSYHEGYGEGNILASYVHAHWSSNPDIPRAIVHSCV